LRPTKNIPVTPIAANIQDQYCILILLYFVGHNKITKHISCNNCRY